MMSKAFLFFALGLVALSAASPVPDSDLEYIRVARAADKKPGSKDGIILHFRHKKTGINAQVQLKTKEDFREICLRVFHDKYNEKAIKPCFGIKHVKGEDGLSTLPYRFRIGRLTVYTGEIKLNRKLTTCRNVNLIVVNERVCFKDFKFNPTTLEKHGKVTQICIKLGLKNIGKTFEVCGWFKGKSLVAKKLTPGTYEPQEMEAVEDETLEVVEE